MIDTRRLTRQLSQILPKNSCAERCLERYLADLKRCNNDPDCISRVTGRYVICVLSCSERPLELPEMELPAAQSCRLLEFSSARVTANKGAFFLTVEGEKPYVNMTVELSPRIYIRRPEFWEIEVVGCNNGIGLPKMTPYSVTIDLHGVIGTQGIVVVGADKSKKIPISKKLATA
jgi:hypothetical protein